MHPQFMQLPPPHQVPLQYGPNSGTVRPAPLPSKRTSLHTPNYLNAARNSPHRFTPTTTTDQQLTALLTQYPISAQQQQQQINPTFRRPSEPYNDQDSNIYTEPTLIEHDVARESGTLISGPPIPPPPPPPIFATSTATPSVLNEQLFSCPNGMSGVDLAAGFRGKDIEFNFADLGPASELGQPQASHSQLTITGQDLEITLNNGEMTQTVLNNSFTAGSTTGQLHPHLLYYYSSQRVEFLPLCDLLFNIISLVAYFCNVVFDSVTAYTLYLNEQTLWLVVSLVLILVSITVSQVLSYTWLLRDRKYKQRIAFERPTDPNLPNGALDLASPFELQSSLSMGATHILCCGVLWRYFKLFAPVNLATVKGEVRDLCVLRMVHGFCEAAPMLLLQVYLVWNKPVDSINDLNIISIFLSLFSICWALSSFSKNIRHSQIHKLVLTWLGVIFQFFWRFGTITSRIVALTVYATVYQQWMFVVLFLHWFSMFLWLSTPTIGTGFVDNGPATSEKSPSRRERIFQNALVAWVCIFCFINMEDTNPRHKMTAYYCTMFLENILLLSISVFFDKHSPWYRHLVLFLVVGSFLFGLFFMWLYYRFFHIRYLKHTLDSVDTDTNYNSNPRPNNPACQGDLIAPGKAELEAKNMAPNVKSSPISRLVSALSSQIFPSMHNSQSSASRLSTSDRHRSQFSNDNIPGVFNCRLNPALKRKKKKPSTVPPPPQPEPTMLQSVVELPIEHIGMHSRGPLETINEAMPHLESADLKAMNAHDFLASTVHHPYRRQPVHQIQRPSTNTSILTRQMRQPSADTFWRKSALSARSLSISPSAMLKSESTFRLPAKHPFSSTITTPTSPVNFVPTENFTDKLEACFEQNQLNTNAEQRSKAILRPKPIVQNSIDLDSIDVGQAEFGVAEGSEAFDQNVIQFASQENGSLLQYYYHPYTGKLKLRTQTPEVLLLPHNDRSRVFYNYPSTVISMPPNALKSEQSWRDDMYMQVLSRLNGTNTVEDEEEIFTRQCQRPPVPGREGDDKSEENNGNNCSYVEGKRSLLNYGMDRSRLEKILEQKVESKEALAGHKSQFSKTLPSEKASVKGKHTRYLTGAKKKKYSSKSSNKRSSVRVMSQQSVKYKGSSSSTQSDCASSVSSSGDDGDIESDINHEHDHIGPTRPSTVARSAKCDAQNVYDQVQDDVADHSEALTRTKDSAEPWQAGGETRPLPQIIRGPAHHQLAPSQERPLSSDAQRISNYHLGSELRNSCNYRARQPNLNAAMSRPKPLYHSAKYKRHNTPL